MARRVSWTNNSSGHSGTYVYRAPTLDPQDLPAPVATVDPVAQGATAEWIDNEDISAGDYDYAVQDFDGQGAGSLSAVETHTVPDDYSTVQVGDGIGGGVYAGTIAYADAREFHLVFAKEAGEASGLAWGNHGTVTGADDPDDGWANQQQVLDNHDNGSAAAFYHCRDYTAGGHSDWYVPARNELILADQLFDMGHPEFDTSITSYRLSSTENNDFTVFRRRWDASASDTVRKDSTGNLTRPIRRVPV